MYNDFFLSLIPGSLFYPFSFPLCPNICISRDTRNAPCFPVLGGLGYFSLSDKLQHLIRTFIRVHCTEFLEGFSNFSIKGPGRNRVSEMLIGSRQIPTRSYFSRKSVRIFSASLCIRVHPHSPEPSPCSSCRRKCTPTGPGASCLISERAPRR